MQRYKGSIWRWRIFTSVLMCTMQSVLMAPAINGTGLPASSLMVLSLLDSSLLSSSISPQLSCSWWFMIVSGSQSQLYLGYLDFYLSLSLWRIKYAINCSINAIALPSAKCHCQLSPLHIQRIKLSMINLAAGPK